MCVYNICNRTYLQHVTRRMGNCTGPITLGLRKQSSQDRLDELLQSPAFHRIHQRHGERPSSLSSTLAYCLRTVDGDLEKEHLGLAAASYDKFLAQQYRNSEVLFSGPKC